MIRKFNVYIQFPWNFDWTEVTSNGTFIISIILSVFLVKQESIALRKNCNRKGNFCKIRN